MHYHRPFSSTTNHHCSQWPITCRLIVIQGFFKLYSWQYLRVIKVIHLIHKRFLSVCFIYSAFLVDILVFGTFVNRWFVCGAMTKDDFFLYKIFLIDYVLFRFYILLWITVLRSNVPTSWNTHTLVTPGMKIQLEWSDHKRTASVKAHQTT